MFSAIGVVVIVAVVLVVAVAALMNNYRKAEYDALVARAKAKGIDLLSK